MLASVVTFLACRFMIFHDKRESNCILFTNSLRSIKVRIFEAVEHLAMSVFACIQFSPTWTWLLFSHVELKKKAKSNNLPSLTEPSYKLPSVLHFDNSVLL